MKKLIFSLCAVVIMVLSGCSKYDDGPLTNRVDNLEKRVATLEELYKQITTNVSSFQTLVNAMKDNDVITSISPLKEGNDEVGYTITFSNSPAIYIINEYKSLRAAYPYIAARRLYFKAFCAKITAVFLTVLSTVLGFIPFIIGATREGFWFPLAAGTMGGLIMSILAILLFLPIMIIPNK